MKLRVRTWLVITLLTTLVGCNDRWATFVDTALELEQNRLHAEAYARTIKATFGSSDPAFIQCRALYEAGRIESQNAFFVLARAASQSKQTGLLADHVERSSLSTKSFIDAAQHHLRDQQASERGLLQQAVRIARAPIAAFTSADPGKDIRAALTQIRDAVAWAPWENVR